MIIKRILAGFLAIIMLGNVVGCGEERVSYTTEESSVEQSRETAQNEVQEDVRESEPGKTDVHTTEEVDAESQEEFFNKIIENGDSVYLGCYRKPLEGKEEPEYLGGALLCVDESETQFVKSEMAYPEAVVKDVVRQVQGKRWGSETIRSYDEQYEYWFNIGLVNWYKEPSYELPKDWDYRFAAPQIGSFQEYSLEHAGTDDKENGEYFGFPDWLTDGCSDWCGCMDYVCEVEATSELANQGSINYSASNLRAASRNSVWAEGVEGNGIGESIFVKQMYAGTGDVEFTISDICIVNGYAQNETKWQENGRVKSLELYYQDEYMGLITLEDTMNPQFIDVRPVQMKVGNGLDSNFRFEIAEVYEGTKYEDTCLTGILIDFEGKSAH